MAQPRKFPQFPLAETLTGNELVLLWQGLGNRRITLDTLKAFFGEGGGGGGGGFTEVGAGLSIDGDGNPQLGDGDNVIFVVDEKFEVNQFSFNLDGDNYGGYESKKITTEEKTEYLDILSFFKVKDTFFNDLAQIIEERLTNGTSSVYKMLLLGRTIQANEFWYNTFQISNGGFLLERKKDAGYLEVKTQSLKIGDPETYDENERIVFLDEVLQRGAGDAADYSATKEDLDYVTKLMLDNYYPEGFILTTNTVSFNRDNVSGITTARTGDVLVDLTNAKVYGTYTMIHNDATTFGFFLPDGVTPFVMYQTEGTYDDTGDNILDFQFIGDGKVRLTISQPD